MDWAQHIKINIAQNLKKKIPNKTKQTTFARLNSERNLVKHFLYTIYNNDNNRNFIKNA